MSHREKSKCGGGEGKSAQECERASKRASDRARQKPIERESAEDRKHGPCDRCRLRPSAARPGNVAASRDAVSPILTAVAPDRATARAGAEPRRLMGLALKAAAEAAAPRRRIVRRMLGKSVVGTDVQIECVLQYISSLKVDRGTRKW